MLKLISFIFIIGFVVCVISLSVRISIIMHYLRKFNQFEKVKKLVENGAVFAGQSAGAIVAGSDTEWTLESEPYEYDLKQEFGKDALMGFGFIDKLVFVHASKHRFPLSQ